MDENNKNMLTVEAGPVLQVLSSPCLQRILWLFYIIAPLKCIVSNAVLQCAVYGVITAGCHRSMEQVLVSFKWRFGEAKFFPSKSLTPLI